MRRLAVTAALVVSAVLVIAQPALASWQQQNTPVPSGTNPTWGLSAVSCTGTATCMAVGTVNSSLLAESRSGNTWTIVSIPDPGGGQLPGIWCTSSSSCEAVGRFDNGGTTQTLAEEWNGSSWSVQATPNPAGVTSSQLNDVSCVSASRCEAVGEAAVSGGNLQTLAEEWNGSNWTITGTQDVGGAVISELNGVSCTAANSCEAVGESRTGNNFPALAEKWNGSNWTIQSTSLGTFSPLEGVSCTAANACTATGSGLAARWDGSNWTMQTIAKPKGSGTSNADLSRVSCTDKTRCMAVGSFPLDAVETAVAEQWDGSKWTIKDTPINTANDSSGLFGLSCTFATACTAVGFYHDPNGPNHALAEDWSLRWQLQPPQIPTGAIASSLQTVSCPSVNFCAAVGGDEQSGSVFDAVVETWNGKNWFVGTTPNASNSNLSGVSCNGAKACTAVGDAVGSGSTLVSLAERWDGTAWTVQSTPNPVGAVHSFLISVSCASVKACTAVGFWTNSGGKQTPFAEQWNGTSWTLKTVPAPSGSTTAQLNGLACTSSSSCEAVGSDNTQSWAEVWNGTVWSIQSIATPNGGRGPHLNGVDCTVANACTAVGDFVNASNKVVPLAERWTGTSWSVQNAKVPAGSISEFSSVSCSTTQFTIGCNAVGFVTKNGISLPMAESWNGSSWAVRPTQSPDPSVSRSTFSSVSCSSPITCMGVGFYDTSTGVEAPLGELYS